MYKTIPEIFFETVARHPKKPALLYKKEGVYFPIRYAELEKKVKVFACALQKLGVLENDKLAILSENRPEWVISDLAIMLTGAVVVPLHTTLNATAICNILNHCKAKILVISNADFLNKALVGRKNLQWVEKIIVMDKIGLDQKEILPGKILNFNALISLHEKDQFEKIFLDPDAICSMIYTSGTTGNPKGVMLTHRNLLSNVESMGEIMNVDETDIFLSFLPLSHILERMAGYYFAIWKGATIAYSEGIKHLAVNFKEVRPTILISVPRVFEKFHDSVWDKINASGELKKKIFKWALKQQKGGLSYKLADFLVFKKIRRFMGGKIKFTFSGGASLNPNIGKFFHKLGILILEGYGLTETSPVLAVNRETDFKFGTVGKPAPGVKLKISPSKEILAKGPNITQGYFENQEATKYAFDTEGWFCTGDLGFLDREGFLSVIGRAKEMIVTSGGKNVWPEPIENIINNDRFISQSMVVGNNRKFVSALIVPDWQEIKIYMKENGLALQEHEELAKNSELFKVFWQRFEEKINLNLNDYEKIKKIVIIPQEFSQENDELTPTLKLRRHIIEKHHQKEIEEIYA